MKEEYREFVQELLEELRDATGFTRELLYFAEKGVRFAENGDRIFVECASHGDAKEICGIYVEELFARYREGTSLKEIKRQVLAELRRVQSIDFRAGLQKLDSYETARDALFIRLVNEKQHAGDLKNAIYQTLGEIAIVLYFKVTEADGCVTSLKIRREYLARWGRTEENVFREALENTARMAQPRIYFWEKMLVNEGYNGEAFLDTPDSVRLHTDALGNCLSTDRKTNGAVAIFLPGVAKRLSDMLGGDLYLAFTSIHEVMVHNAAGVEAEELREVLAETIRESTAEEDYLSSCIYRYHRELSVFSCVSPGEKQKILPEDFQ